jgi:hypothetical protein
VGKDLAAAPEGMRGVRVRVTARDIALGHRRNCQACPVALALTRHLADGYYVNVAPDGGGVFATSSDGPERYVGSFRLPTKVKKFIEAFDAGRELCAKAFAFNLPLPLEALKRKGAARG